MGAVAVLFGEARGVAETRKAPERFHALRSLALCDGLLAGQQRLTRQEGSDSVYPGRGGFRLHDTMRHWITSLQLVARTMHRIALRVVKHDFAERTGFSAAGWAPCGRRGLGL